MKIALVAPSSKVPPVEVELAREKLLSEGFEVDLPKKLFSSHLFFAGTDEIRAKLLIAAIEDPSVDILWAVRGGSGAVRVLEILAQKYKKKKKLKKQKIYVGYSDSTGIMDFLHRQLGFEIIHGPMPGLKTFCELPEKEWNPLMKFLKQDEIERPWGSMHLKQICGPALKSSLSAEWVGGNLTVLASLAGTPFAISAKAKVLFLEDVDELPYRIDRCLSQLHLSGGLKGVKAIVLGDFTRCEDKVVLVLKNPEGELTPLRATLKLDGIFREIFGEISSRYKIPVFCGMTCGHGPNFAPLPFYRKIEIEPSLALKIRPRQLKKGSL